MAREEIVVKLDPRPPRGWLCPACGGLGHAADGMLSVGQYELRYRPATPCSLCRGKGRVAVSPLPDEE
jgi:RecJ-like exonuclease